MSLLSRIVSLADRSPASLLQDLLGATALFAMLVAGLYLPGPL